MTASNTPGPWKVTDRFEISMDDGDVCPLVATVNADAASVSDKQAEADAHLIAAAPDMLAALEAFRKGLADGSIKWANPRQSDSDPFHPANVAMCAALAKVRGEN